MKVKIIPPDELFLGACLNNANREVSENGILIFTPFDSCNGKIDS